MRIFITLLILIALASCNRNQEKAASKKEEAKTDSVKVFVLTLDSAKKTLSLPGELDPNENVQIRAKIQGYIRKLNVDIGSKVSKGQVLALIDAPEINSRVQEFNEKIKAARSRLQSSKDYYERINTASQTDGVIAPSELQRTKNQMMADSSNYNASVFAASSYRLVGSYLAIVAPFSGVITKRNIEVGSFVGNANEKPLFELEDNITLRLSVPVPEIYTGAVLLDNSCELTTRSFPDKKFKAKLIRKAGSIDEETRSEVWEFEIPNANRELKAGSYADVKLHFLRSSQSLVVPVSAVVTTLEKKFVIKIVGNTTQWIDVRAGFNMGDKVEVFGELNSGDTLVLKTTEELKAGTKVIPKLSN
ncbi:MAG: efflux RND transporter periplasmic adaptor subunit [Chitinophagaceae bacterium]|nr:efflux RND transporter periplasmic adaptor subunit [Chitinophagaceae bacterium]